MQLREAVVEESRFLASGDESGTAPGDRAFRPDVEGLRAVAVLVVVLFHAGIGRLTGGYVGVDVFFVISGFVITGVLLRERASRGANSLLAFYGRRARRIIPAATLVMVVTVILSYSLLGQGIGGQTASDGRWAAVFLANFHFVATGTSYLGAQRLPSPLQNLWSLSVEEQFYVVYPTLFLLAAGLRTRLSLRVRLALLLAVVVCVSFTLSVANTASSPTAAYFSPFTRAWELALGALVSVGTPWLRSVPSRLAIACSWAGLGAIVYSSFAFSTQTSYPGAAVGLPVLGAALVIAGGTREARGGAERLLGLAPCRGLGKISYSLYLWHWPILMLVAERTGKATVPLPESFVWVLVAVACSILTYVLVENPIRHAKVLIRVRLASVGLGALLVVGALGAIGAAAVVSSPGPVSSTSVSVSGGAIQPGKGAAPRTVASLESVLALVTASNQIQTVPPGVVPSLSQAVAADQSTIGLPTVRSGCWPQEEQSTVATCVFGDRSGGHTMVLYGDSHAAMWFHVLDRIAQSARWRLVVLTKGSCPAAPLPTAHPIQGFGAWPACQRWHRWALHRIDQIHPDLLVVSQSPTARRPDRSYYPATQWQSGLRTLLRSVDARRTVVLGNLPATPGPSCVAAHTDDVQACGAGPQSFFFTPYNRAEAAAATAAGARYVDVTPWFCAERCSPIIGNYEVYVIGNHVTDGYALYLQGALAAVLRLPSAGAPAGT